MKYSGCSDGDHARMNIKKYTYSVESMGGKDLFKLETVTGMRTLALIIERKRVCIRRSTLKQFKWMLDYRRERTARYLRQPTKRGSELDEENEKHVHFNEMVREVYEIICRLHRGSE